MLQECVLNQHMFQAHVLKKTGRNEIKCKGECTLRMTKKKQERKKEMPNIRWFRITLVVT
jgi:hypothetical protein